MKNELTNKKKLNAIPLIVSIGIPLILGGAVTLLIPNIQHIYDQLIKPVFAPPPIVFPIVWTILYVLMGIAAYKVYALKYEGIDSSSAIFVYGLQLLLNVLWSFIFFGFRLYGLAFLELVVLFLFVILTIVRFYKKAGAKVAALLIPYLIWLLYAGTLNFFIWMLNEM